MSGLHVGATDWITSVESHLKQALILYRHNVKELNGENTKWKDRFEKLQTSRDKVVEKMCGVQKECDDLKQQNGQLKQSLDILNRSAVRSNETCKVCGYLQQSMEALKDAYTKTISEKDNTIAMLETRLAGKATMETEHKYSRPSLKSPDSTLVQDPGKLTSTAAVTSSSSTSTTTTSSSKPDHACYIEISPLMPGMKRTSPCMSSSDDTSPTGRGSKRASLRLPRDQPKRVRYTDGKRRDSKRQKTTLPDRAELNSQPGDKCSEHETSDKDGRLIVPDTCVGDNITSSDEEIPFNRVLTENYTKALLDNVSEDVGISRHRKEKLPRVKKRPTIVIPETLAMDMNEFGDYCEDEDGDTLTSSNAGGEEVGNAHRLTNLHNNRMCASDLPENSNKDLSRNFLFKPNLNMNKKFISVNDLPVETQSDTMMISSIGPPRISSTPAVLDAYHTKEVLPVSNMKAKSANTDSMNAMNKCNRLRNSTSSNIESPASKELVLENNSTNSQLEIRSENVVSLRENNGDVNVVATDDDDDFPFSPVFSGSKYTTAEETKIDDKSSMLFAEIKSPIVIDSDIESPQLSQHERDKSIKTVSGHENFDKNENLDNSISSPSLLDHRKGQNHDCDPLHSNKQIVASLSRQYFDAKCTKSPRTPGKITELTDYNAVSVSDLPDLVEQTKDGAGNASCMPASQSIRSSPRRKNRVKDKIAISFGGQSPKDKGVATSSWKAKKLLRELELPKVIVKSPQKDMKQTTLTQALWSSPRKKGKVKTYCDIETVESDSPHTRQCKSKNLVVSGREKHKSSLQEVQNTAPLTKIATAAVLPETSVSKPSKPGLENSPPNFKVPISPPIRFKSPKKGHVMMSPKRLANASESKRKSFASNVPSFDPDETMAPSELSSEAMCNSSLLVTTTKKFTNGSLDPAVHLTQYCDNDDDNMESNTITRERPHRVSRKSSWQEVSGSSRCRNIETKNDGKQAKFVSLLRSSCTKTHYEDRSDKVDLESQDIPLTAQSYTFPASKRKQKNQEFVVENIDFESALAIVDADSQAPETSPLCEEMVTTSTHDHTLIAHRHRRGRSGEPEAASPYIKPPPPPPLSCSPGMDNSFDRVPRKESPGYAYVEVVRKHAERRQLPAYDCQECFMYFSGLGLPDDEIAKRMKNCSRHRARYAPPSTPDNFWSIGFPDTQECKDRGYTKVDTQKGPSRFRRRRQLTKRFTSDKNTGATNGNSDEEEDDDMNMSDLVFT